MPAARGKTLCSRCGLPGGPFAAMVSANGGPWRHGNPPYDCDKARLFYARRAMEALMNGFMSGGSIADELLELEEILGPEAAGGVMGGTKIHPVLGALAELIGPDYDYPLLPPLKMSCHDPTGVEAVEAPISAGFIEKLVAEDAPDLLIRAIAAENARRERRRGVQD